MFRDITTLLHDSKGFTGTVDALVAHHEKTRFDHVAGIEARGFIVGGAVAHRLGYGFIPVRKKGKLPAEVLAEEYELEYGTDTVEIHKDAVKPGDEVLLVDDLIATGGTALAAIKLIEKAGGKVTACSFVIDLPDLGGARKIEALGIPVVSLVDFEGD
jgi:adenine phosphoribosyltransferase